MDKTLQTMHRLASDARKNAYAPYSNFKVGVCLRADNGDFFTGCNVENVSYGLTQCAEATAIAELVKQGQRIISDVVIVADSETCCAPCGACRQRLFEFANANTQVYFFNKAGEYEVRALAELLPFPFSNKVLGEK